MKGVYMQTTIDTNNFNAMAQAMGMNADMTSEKKTSQLARLKIQHSPIMGEIEVKGKRTQAAVINGGSYKLEDLENDRVLYADKVTIRPYVQRFMYKKFVKPESGKGFFVKTVLSDNLNIDLKDTSGGFNCGKPAGYVKDYASLPDKTKALLKSIKRVRAVIGTVSMDNAYDHEGQELVTDGFETSFIWEIDNRDAFKIMGDSINKIATMKHLPIQHMIQLGSEERKLPNGSSFYLPTTSVLPDVHDVTDEVQERFDGFMQWIENYNIYVFNKWTEKSGGASKANSLSQDETETVDDFVDVSNGLDDEIPF